MVYKVGIKGNSATRLETRTKEFNLCASYWGKINTLKGEVKAIKLHVEGRHWFNIPAGSSSPLELLIVSGGARAHKLRPERW